MTSTLPPRPYDLPVDEAQRLADELRRQARLLTSCAAAIETGIEEGPHRSGAVHGYRAAAELLEEEAAHIVARAQAYQRGLDLACAEYEHDQQAATAAR